MSGEWRDRDILERLETAAYCVEETSITGIGFAEDFREAARMIETARLAATQTMNLLTAIRSDLNYLHGGDLEIADSIELLRDKLAQGK